MIVKDVIGNLKDISRENRTIEYVELEWYETSKRILHKQTSSGRQVQIKFLSQTQTLAEGDVLCLDKEMMIVVLVKPCETIVIKPGSMYEMAFTCYEIGNKHLPLFYENGELMIPHEAPILRLLTAAGLKPYIEHRKLLHQLNTTVRPHGDTDTKSLFSRILHLTSPNE